MVCMMHMWNNSCDAKVFQENIGLLFHHDYKNFLQILKQFGRLNHSDLFSCSPEGSSPKIKMLAELHSRDSRE